MRTALTQRIAAAEALIGSQRIELMIKLFGVWLITVAFIVALAWVGHQ